MHLLFLTPWHPWPPDNGSRIRVSQLLRSLTARHEVSLITFAGEPEAPDAEGLVALGLCRRAVVLPERAFARTTSSRLRGLFSPMPSHLYAVPTAGMKTAARRILAQHPAQAIITTTTTIAEVGISLPAPCHILEEHNFLGRMMRDRFEAASGPLAKARAWATWRKDIAWERRLFHRFDLVTMVSETDKAAIQAMACATTRIEVVPNGVDAAACALVQAAAQPVPDTVIYPGALTYDANLDAVRWFAAEVWPIVRRARPNARFLVTGKTDGVDTASLAQTPGLQLTGYLPDVRPTLAAAQVCVIPLRQGGGSRLKVLEAMALGVPVLSTNKGTEGLEVEDGRHCVVADEAEVFASALNRLLGDQDAGQRLARAALDEVVTHYDWGPIAERFLALVEQSAHEAAA